MLMHIDFPAPALPPRRLALWDLGFRPFYLLAAISAALSVPLWALQFAGALPGAYLQGPAWHAHEMIFGYTLAVIVGFLFTAGRNWSGQPTPTGPALMALAALWLAGRVLVLTPWAVAAALATVAFPLAAAWGLARALRRGGNRNNDFFVALLVALGAAAGVVHAVLRGWLVLPGNLGQQAALDLVLFMMVLMGGRVIPGFSNNGAPGTDAQRHPGVERLALAAPLLLLALDLLDGVPGWRAPAVAAGVAAAAAVVHAERLRRWHPWRTRKVPLVWVLHAAYLWIPVHLALRAGAAAGLWSAGPALHALTVGAIGTLTLAMMTRSARGHTGRPLKADAFDRVIYASVLAAAVLRVLLPLLWPALLVPAALASAAAWMAAFGLFAAHYGPWLCRPRADGRPG